MLEPTGQGGAAGVGSVDAGMGLTGVAGLTSTLAACDELQQIGPDWFACIGDATCPAPDCAIDGVCFPDGTMTEDGCCYCDNGLPICLNSPVCPSAQLISKRCASEGDCNFPGTRSGLQCRDDVDDILGLGSRDGVCTRPCSYGCPSGTICVGNTDADGGMLDEHFCLRICLSHGGCQRDEHDRVLGSDCINASPTAYCL